MKERPLSGGPVERRTAASSLGSNRLSEAVAGPTASRLGVEREKSVRRQVDFDISALDAGSDVA